VYIVYCNSSTYDGAGSYDSNGARQSLDDGRSARPGGWGIITVLAAAADASAAMGPFVDPCCIIQHAPAGW
jgi:hypothetical protein